MKYLFLDTSSNILSIAILDDQKIIKEEQYSSHNDQSKYAVFKLANLFKESNIEPEDINKLLVINGPGSFTGIRIGVTIIKTYAWSLNKPVIPISSLKAHALSQTNSDYYVSFIDARRNAVYAGIYDQEYNDVIPECYMTLDKLMEIINKLEGRVVITGDFNINEFEVKPIALDVLKIVDYYKDKESINGHELKPNYLKKVEAEEKLLGVLE